MTEPAHSILVKQYLDWEIVSARLNRYKYIEKVFPIADLQKCSTKAPFYCHYLGWRLGTWGDEELFEFIDKLLGIGINLPGWKENKRVPKGCEFGNFWSFIWELQVAAFFADQLGIKTQWINSGPDMEIITETSTFFVECTTYHKSYAIEEFIQELFCWIHPDIKAEHVPCIQFSLPQNNETDIFLNDLFTPYLDASFLPKKLEESKQESPLLLPTPSTAKNFYIYLTNKDAKSDNLELEQILTSAGDPKAFLEHSLKEIINNKGSANNLDQNHPNILMTNFLLGKDWQLTRSLRSSSNSELSAALDGVLLTACGINKIPSFHNSTIHYKPGHPIELIRETALRARKH